MNAILSSGGVLVHIFYKFGGLFQILIQDSTLFSSTNVVFEA